MGNTVSRIELSDEQEEFLRLFLRSGWLVQSAKRAGVKPSLASKWINDPESPVRQEYNARKKVLRDTSIFGAKEAMDEAREAMVFAEETGNANAYVKAVELRSKLSGLLIDKIDARLMGAFTVNISGIDDAPKEQIAAQVVAALLPGKPEEDDDEDSHSPPAELEPELVTVDDSTADESELVMADEDIY